MKQRQVEIVMNITTNVPLKTLRSWPMWSIMVNNALDNNVFVDSIQANVVKPPVKK